MPLSVPLLAVTSGTARVTRERSLKPPPDWLHGATRLQAVASLVLYSVVHFCLFLLHVLQWCNKCDLGDIHTDTVSNPTDFLKILNSHHPKHDLLQSIYWYWTMPWNYLVFELRVILIENSFFKYYWLLVQIEHYMKPCSSYNSTCFLGVYCES